MASLSVITITLNEERNIKECLSSVAWADELIVIDSGSTDRTIEIARCFTSNIHPIEWHGYGAARNFGLSRATGEWVLWLDADERVTDELAAEIQLIVGKDDHAVAGYDIARRAFFLGKWIRHCGWYPSRVTRLFRRGAGKFTESRVHEELKVNGTIRRMLHDINHYTDPDLEHYFSKFNRYTSLAAHDLASAGRTSELYDLLVRPSFAFFKMYVLRLGVLDGMHGFVLSIVSSAYVFTKYAKLWELQKGNPRQGNEGGRT